MAQCLKRHDLPFLLYCILGSKKKKLHTFSFHLLKDQQIYIVPNYLLEKDLVFDVAVTCLLQHKYYHSAAQSVGFACNTYIDKMKIKNYQERVENKGCTYRFLQDLPDFLLKLLKRMSLCLKDSKSTITKYMCENLSCALMNSICIA